MANKLVIVEFKEEAEYFAQRPDLLTSKTKILSLLPEATAYLRNKNIPCEDTLEYFSRQSHERGLKAVDKAINEINQAVSFEDDNGLSHTYLNVFTFFLRAYISYVISTIEIIMNCIDAHKIEDIEICRYDRRIRGEWLLAAQEHRLDQIVQLITVHVPIKVKVHAIAGASLARNFVQWPKAVYQMFYHHVAVYRSQRLGRSSVLFYGLKFNFDRLAKELNIPDVYNLVPDKGKAFQFTEVKDGIFFHCLQLDYLWPVQDSRFLNSLTRMLQIVEKLQIEKKLFVFRNVDFSMIVMEKIKKDFVSEFKVLNRKVRSLKKILAIIRPALIISPMARELSFALGEISRLLKIPSVLISHGSHVPPKNEYERMEWFDHGKGLIDTEYQYHLLQSPWAVQYVESLGIKKDYYRIMPLIFPKVDRSKKQEKQLAMYPASAGKKVIVHASTPKARGSNRLYIYETMDEYIQNMIDLIEAVKNMPDVFLIIRFRPSEYLQTEDLKELLPVSNHYVIATEGSFNDYLTIADLVVSFSSTTIEEALINHIAVLQYDRTGRYQHIEGAQWTQGCFSQKDSVYFIGQQSNLKDGVRWIVQQHLSQPTPNGLFDRHVFDPQKTITAAEFIRRVLNGESNVSESLEETLVGNRKG